jgi:hypothetical protein
MERFEIVKESGSDITLTVKFPQLHYLNEFIGLKCAPLLLDMFPNVKEITESMAAFNAVRRYLGAENFGNDSIILFDIGCGHAPRTAALFAHMTCWNCHAIDPVLRQKERYTRTRRLTLHSCKIEDFDGAVSNSTIVITAVHAHIDLNIVVKKFEAPNIIIVAIPCCNPLEIKGCSPIKQYEDLGCLSIERRVKIFNLRW